ncbi:hypothetical protein [Polycyclovorans algicola]|nr:hypothetical protein [Polycyclovorans algicola]
MSRDIHFPLIALAKHRVIVGPASSGWQTQKSPPVTAGFELRQEDKEGGN